MEYQAIWNSIQGKRPPGVAETDAYYGPQILVENLPLDMTAEELNELGWAYGKARSARLWKEKDCKVGIIEYEREEEFVNAINELDGRRMQDWGMKLKCSGWPTPTRGRRASFRCC